MASASEDSRTPADMQETAPDMPPTTITVETALEHARRALALKKYEQAIEYYATALELHTKKSEDETPALADLYFAYGKALLENAIIQASVLGKEPEPGAQGEEEKRPGTILEFGDEGEGEDADAVDLLGQVAREPEEEDEEDEDGEGEPEDDFNAAWEVFELARGIYEKEPDGDDDMKLKLADTYIALGDVSLETEKFNQAITDYSAGLALKTELLPTSSRQIAEAHFRLSIVLDLTSGRLSDAITHVEKALDSVLERIQEVKDGLEGKLPPTPVVEGGQDKKGKGKSMPCLSLAKDLVQNMTRSQMESELGDLEGLKEELASKVEELKTTPKAPTDTAPALVAKGLDQELNVKSIAVPGQPAVVHDLTSLVKKKKKPLESEGGAKRKVDEDDASPKSKKAKLEDDITS